MDETEVCSWIHEKAVVETPNKTKIEYNCLLFGAMFLSIDWKSLLWVWGIDSAWLCLYVTDCLSLLHQPDIGPTQCLYLAVDQGHSLLTFYFSCYAFWVKKKKEHFHDKEKAVYKS